MNSRRRTWLGIALALAVVWVPGGSAQEPIVAVRTGALIDGTGAPPIPGAIVLVKGTRIAEVGANVVIPKEAL